MSELNIKNSKVLSSVIAPQITEKATFVADKYNQVAFKVKKRCN